ncbi:MULTISPECIES: ABC transporter substrate-binding protein [unclassified Leucobacter]|uniref:ABC transporter substrate-binding protein n=1 Tax=unclassified Leucobacter TaxID=2621730 RepID=UPI00165E3E7D|nr:MULTISPECIES: ABC transporter substrate-binding protein [unclassified Leucobacter]MBC9928265.1 ABC transporter substrate-binding protein [Leucobacter sp. cx-169]MBC9937480.1 ABC transporter substrate-binding protein [Leucobacter sp. cx-87]
MQRKNTFLAAAALAATGSLLLAGCSAGAGSTADAGAEKSTKAVLALTGAPTNLDFTTTAGAAIPQAMMSNVYEGLVELNDAGEIEPLLASEWTVSDDRKTYTFTLQDGVTFSNGDAFTADDVKFSFDRVKSDWVSSLKAKMDVVDNVEVLSDTEVAVHLSAPSNAWLFSLATPVGAIFSPDGVADLANAPVGTGPYTVETWTPNESIVLDTRDDYWGEGPGVEQVTLRYFADATATTNALRTGDVDAIINLQAPELLDSFESDDKFKVITGTSSGEVSLSLNNQAAPFDDVRVRQAVLYALDEQAIIDTAWNGYGTPQATFATPTDPYYEDLTDVYAYDPKKAKALLAEAGYENGLDITYTVPTRPYAQAVSEIVVSQLKDVGINVTIKSSEFPAVWLDEVFTNHDYQMTTVLAVEARDILTVFNNPEYYIGYDNSVIAPLAAAADQADEAGYVSGMQDVARQIVDDAASGVLFLFPNIVVAKAGLEGLPENAIIEALNLTDLHWK